MHEKHTGFASATGPVSIPMHNDYLFRALLQRNNRVLKGLICSLLHLDSEQILSVVIANPIELGETIDTKTFFLDVRVILNDHARINLEMQVINELNWVERSLSYLCRSFDTLIHGEDYLSVKPSIQIGLLNFMPPINVTVHMRHSQNRTFSARRCCAAVFAHKMALPSSVRTQITSYASINLSGYD